MDQNDLKSRVDLIEKTLEQTKTYSKFSGLVAIITGVAVCLWAWAASGFGSEKNVMIVESFLCIGVLSFLLATAAGVRKSRQNQEPIFSSALKQILTQGIPFLILSLIAIVSVFATAQSSQIVLCLLVMIPLLYGFFIWSCRPYIPKVVAYFGLVLIFTNSFGAAMLPTVQSVNPLLMMTALTLGLGHIITGLILYKHGQA